MFTGQKAIKFGRKLLLRALPTLGLGRLFTLREENIFGAEKVKYDVQQRRELLGMPINRGGGARRLVGDSFQELEETPPYINISSPINMGDLRGRACGNTEYDPANTDHVTRLINEMTKKYDVIQEAIDRQIEFQASEILQKGIIEFKQFTGLKMPVANYSFGMDTDLFADAAPAWAAATGAQKRAQILAIADNVRKLGKRTATDLIFGRAANDSFWEDDDTLALLDNRRVAIGERMPQPLQADGFAFQGTIVIGAQRYRCWLYEGRFENPETGELDFYIDTNKVVVLAETAERDRMQAGVDIIKPVDANIMELFPGGVSLDSLADRVAAVQIPYAYTDKTAITTEIGIATAPLLVPTNRGGHGCLNTAP